MTAAADLVVRAARNGARVRLKPIDYVKRFGPPAARCGGCEHTPAEHDAGGRLDRLVLEDIASKASWAPATWGEGAWPSVPRIAARIGYCDRSVQYSLRRLVGSGFVELVERPGRSNLFRILRPVEPLGSVDGEPESVDDVGDNRAPADESTAPARVAPGGATVAPDLGPIPTDQPPKAPDRRLGKSDGAAAPAQPRRPERRGVGRATAGTSPPTSIEAGAEPHRRMRGLGVPAGTSPPSYDDALAGLDGPSAGDHGPVRLSRVATRRWRGCPRCGAPPGEPCRNRQGGPRKANHAERRAPNIDGPVGRVLRNPERHGGGEPAF